MGLTAALGIARSGLTATATQTDLVSRNIANIGTEGFSRKTAELTTTSTGGVAVVGVDRSVDATLQRLDRASTSKLAAQTTISDGLKAYTDFLGQPSDETSPSAMMSRFNASLVTLAAQPSEEAAQIAVVTSAAEMASGLNNLSDTLGAVNAEVEQNIRYDVVAANEALREISILNTQLLRSNDATATTAEWQDRMDGLIDEISGIMDIQAIPDGNGMTNIYTGAGTELVVGGDVSVMSYNPATGVLSAGTQDVTPSSSGRGINEGSLGGLFALKNDTLPVLEEQLDSFAMNLIDAMQTANPFGTAGTGLFTDNGAPITGATPVDGIAGRIAVENEALITAGGDPSLLQTGGVAGTLPGDTSYINAMSAGLDASLSYAVPGMGGALNLNELASTLVSTHQTMRADAETATAATKASWETISASRENFEGTNIDDELQKLLVVEQSYAANARVMTTISEMMDAIINAV